MILPSQVSFVLPVAAAFSQFEELDFKQRFDFKSEIRRSDLVLWYELSLRPVFRGASTITSKWH